MADLHSQPDAPDDVLDFGAWLRRRRRALDLTQDAFGQWVGCTGDAVRKIEAGLRRPSHAMAERFARCLEVPSVERPAFVAAARAGRAPTLPAAPPGSRRDQREVPQVPTPALSRGWLPTPLTSFIGRERDVVRLAARVRTTSVRLVTLTGAGGIGKTRLAIRVGEAMRESFADGVWFVDLAPVSDPALVIQTIAQHLDVREQQGHTVLDSLIAAIRDRRLLLVLDNVEHVIRAAPDVAQLLRATPGLKVLATSREALHLSGEQVLLVAPLDVPAAQVTLTTHQYEQYPAVQLFAERAQEVADGFALTDGNAEVVAAICRQLDGLPLAIELAAAWTRLYSPPQLLARLERRLHVLTEAPRDLPTRQRTLRDTIAWSHALLTADEQALFRRLGVFAGGCTVAAAEQVCDTTQNASGSIEAQVTLLLDKSLLRRLDGGGNSPRVGMLETIREYALEQLDGAGEMLVCRVRHASYYADLATTTVPQLRGSDQQRVLRLLVAERDNLRAALDWTLRGGGDGAAGGAMTTVLADFWYYQGHLREGLTWLKLALDGNNAGDSSTHAYLLRRSVPFMFYTGDYTGARGAQQEALALYRAIDDRRGVAESVKELTEVAWLLGDLAHAAALASESLELFRALGDVPHAARSLSLLGDVRREQGRYAEARQHFTEALAEWRALGDRNEYASTLNGLGDTLFDEGDLAGARHAFEEALAETRATGWEMITAFGLSNLGYVALLEGNLDGARAMLEESMAWFRDAGVFFGITPRLHRLAAVLHAQGDTEGAKAMLREVLPLQWQLGNPRWIAESFEIRAHIACAEAAWERAAGLWGAATALRTDASMPLPPVYCEQHQVDTSAAWEHLGRNAFEGAWASTGAMSRGEMQAFSNLL